MKLLRIPLLYSILTITLLCMISGCKDQQFDSKGAYVYGQEIKAHMNQMSIACPVATAGVAIADFGGVVISDFDAEDVLKVGKKYVVQYEDLLVDIWLSKITKDGYEFRYTTDVPTFTVGEKTHVIRDEGQIWLYCDDYKKWNEPKARKEPELPRTKMVTVE